MARLVNTQTGKFENFTNDDAFHTAIIEGTHYPDPDEVFRAVGPDGLEYEFPGDEFENMVFDGYRRKSDAEQLEDMRLEEAGRRPEIAAVLSALDGGTIGASSLAMEKLGIITPEQRERYRLMNPVASIGGELLGFGGSLFVPFAPAAKIAQFSGKAGQVAAEGFAKVGLPKFAGSLAEVATRGGVFNSALNMIETGEDFLRGKEITVENTFTHGVDSFLLGSAVDLTATGSLKVLGKLFNFLGHQAKGIATKAIGSTPELTDKMLQRPDLVQKAITTNSIAEFQETVNTIGSELAHSVRNGEIPESTALVLLDDIKTKNPLLKEEIGFALDEAKTRVKDAGKELTTTNANAIIGDDVVAKFSQLDQATMQDLKSFSEASFQELENLDRASGGKSPFTKSQILGIIDDEIKGTQTQLSSGEFLELMGDAEKAVEELSKLRNVFEQLENESLSFVDMKKILKDVLGPLYESRTKMDFNPVKNAKLNSIYGKVNALLKPEAGAEYERLVGKTQEIIKARQDVLKMASVRKKEGEQLDQAIRNFFIKTRKGASGEGARRSLSNLERLYEVGGADGLARNSLGISKDVERFYHYYDQAKAGMLKGDPMLDLQEVSAELKQKIDNQLMQGDPLFYKRMISDRVAKAAERMEAARPRLSETQQKILDAAKNPSPETYWIEEQLSQAVSLNQLLRQNSPLLKEMLAELASYDAAVLEDLVWTAQMQKVLNGDLGKMGNFNLLGSLAGGGIGAAAARTPDDIIPSAIKFILFGNVAASIVEYYGPSAFKSMIKKLSEIRGPITPSKVAKVISSISQGTDAVLLSTKYNVLKMLEKYNEEGEETREKTSEQFFRPTTMYVPQRPINNFNGEFEAARDEVMSYMGQVGEINKKMTDENWVSMMLFPDLTNIYLSKIDTVYKFLFDRLPVPYNNFLNEGFVPADEKAKFLRYYNAARYPEDIFKDIANGHISPEQEEFLNVAMPESKQDLIQKIFEKMLEGKRPLMENLILLQQLSGVELTSIDLNDLSSVLQQTEVDSNVQAQNLPRKPTIKLRAGERAETTGQRMEQRA